MRLQPYRSDFSVKLVVGTEVFSCSGVILARHSTVFLEMIQQQAELYLDQFTDCLEGLLDGIDLLYGAQVTLTLHNIQPLLKFSLLYKVGGVLEVCLDWVKKELSMVNLFTFCKVGLFLKSVEVERGEVLKACKDFLVKRTADDLLEISKTWPEDESVMDFLLDKEMLSVTLPTVTEWVNTEKKVVMILDKIENCQLQEALSQIPTLHLAGTTQDVSETSPKVKRPRTEPEAVVQAALNASNPMLQLLEKMQDVCDTAPNLKRVCKLQSFLFRQSQLQIKRPLVPLELNSICVLRALQPRKWRNFTCEEMVSLHSDYKIEEFFFAEIMLDWISFTKPTQKAVQQLWEIVKDSNVSQEYLIILRTSVRSYVVESELTKSEKELANRLNNDSYVFSDDIKAKLTNPNVDPLIRLRADCWVKGCTQNSKFIKDFRLCDTVPCYQLGIEGVAVNGHYHHDKIKHWYLTEEKNGERVLLSLVTNTMAEVIEKVKVSNAIHLYYLRLRNYF